jgi:Ca-activated chloride channel homolog
MKVMKPLLSIFVTILFFAHSFFSQQNQTERAKPSKPDEETIKLGATLVQVPVIVSEPGGRYVIDLVKQDFALYEDGVRQEVEFFGDSEEPFTVALLLDSSGSTMDQLDKIKDSAISFINKLKTNDKVMIVSFNDSVQVHCEPTSNPAQLLRAVRSIRPGEFTQVYEAIYTAVWERLNNYNGRKAVIIFTDGIDTASSEITLEDTLDAVVEGEDILVYPIRYDTRPEVEKRIERKITAGTDTESGTPLAKRLAEEREKLNQLYKDADDYLYRLAGLSGGVVERADHLRDLDQAFSKIAQELRHQYLLGYYPISSSKRGAERKIKVTVNRQGLKVRARPGYTSSN